MHLSQQWACGTLLPFPFTCLHRHWHVQWFAFFNVCFGWPAKLGCFPGRSHAEMLGRGMFKLEGLPLTVTAVELDNSRLELRVLGLDCPDELNRLEAALQSLGPTIGNNVDFTAAARRVLPNVAGSKGKFVPKSSKERKYIFWTREFASLLHPGNGGSWREPRRSYLRNTHHDLQFVKQQQTGTCLTPVRTTFTDLWMCSTVLQQGS